MGSERGLKGFNAAGEEKKEAGGRGEGVERPIRTGDDEGKGGRPSLSHVHFSLDPHVLEGVGLAVSVEGEGIKKTGACKSDAEREASRVCTATHTAGAAQRTATGIWKQIMTMMTICKAPNAADECRCRCSH